MKDRLRILWVKSGKLFPPNTGGRRRTLAMLEQLAKVHEVTYLATLSTDESVSDEEAGASYAQKKIWIPNAESGKRSLFFLLETLRNLLFSKDPFVLDRYRNEDLAKRLSEMGRSGEFDLIICDFLTPAPNFDFDEISTPTILFQHNVEAQIWKRLALGKTNPLSRWYFNGQYRRMWDAERRLCAKFDGVITVSPEDAEQSREDYGLQNVLGAVPTGVDTDFFSPPAIRNVQKGVIGFLGSMDWMPNIECVGYFINEILPTIRERCPDVRFRIIGRNPTPAVKQFAENDSSIEVTGTVDDVRPYLDECEVLVVPLKSGGGTRIKIFEAMAQGVPVVSTTIGAEGLPVVHEQTVLIADTSEAIADAVVRILECPEVGESISVAARKQLVTENSWASVTATFIELCTKR